MDTMKQEKTLRPGVSLRQKTALVLLGIIICLVLLEGGLRLGGFALLFMQDQDNSRSIKQKDAYRILCLGESTTAGQYPPFLEKTLNQRGRGAHFSVVDKGRMGTNTPAILSQVETYLNEYHPDMVVAMMGVNDWGDHIPFEAPTASKGMSFIRSFRTYKLTRLLWLHLLNKGKELGFFKPKEAIGINPKNDNSCLEIGRIYREQGKFSQAEDSFKEAIEFNPENDSAYFELGRLFRDQNKYPQAEDAFKKAIEINPKNGKAYFRLGWLYRDQSRFPQSEDAFKKAIEINPKNDMAYLGLGRLYRDQDKTSQAQDAFEEGVKINPENDRLLGTMSAFYEKTGKPELAKEYAKKVDRVRLEYFIPTTANNFRRLKEILDQRGIRLVCVQYPMRDVQPLKEIFWGDRRGIVFVDNEKTFKELVTKYGARMYFQDMFGGDFGHCTQKGNQLLAENIATAILREVFGKGR